MKNQLVATYDDEELDYDKNIEEEIKICDELELNYNENAEEQKKMLRSSSVSSDSYSSSDDLQTRMNWLIQQKANRAILQAKMKKMLE